MLLAREVLITSVLFSLSKELSPVSLIGLLLDKRQRIPYYATLSRKYGFRMMVFGAEDIQWETGKVQGLLLTRGQWYERTLRLPDAVYNRCYPENTPVIQRLEVHGRQIFNSTTLFDKWDVYEILQDSEILRPFLPATYKLVFDDLLDLLEQGTWVIKPRKGQSGRGVYRLELQGDFVFVTGDLNFPLPIPTKAAAASAAVLTNSEPYIVQAYVPGFTSKEGLFDVRLVVQKDKRTKWAITGEISRVAATSGFITNQYKALIHPREILRTLGDRAAAVYEDMRRAALLSAEVLDGPLGHLGELCADFIVDEDGQLWLIEVNGKPDKSLFFEFDDEDMLERVYLTPLMYARTLALERLILKGSRRPIREYMPKPTSKEDHRGTH